MAATTSKYRFLLIHPFSFPPESQLSHRPAHGPKESQLPNYAQIEHVLAGVDWDLHPGPLAPFGDWAVENRAEFAQVAALRLPIVKEACASGRYSAIVLLGDVLAAALRSAAADRNGMGDSGARRL